MERRPRLDWLLRTDEGRVRVGWRLALYFIVAAAVYIAASVALPEWFLSGSIAMLAGAITAGVVVLSLDGRRPGALGFFAGPRAAVESLYGLVLGGSAGLLVVVVLFAVGGLRWTADDGSAVDWVAGSLGALGVLLLPAAAEEALLRGYPLQALAEAWGPIAALAVTGLLFGALHLGNPNVTILAILNVVVAGLFLGVVYLRTASLWWATGAHLAWNWTTGYLADVPVSGLELLDAPLYEGVVKGPDWLGGGSFGPEGSLITMVLLAGVVVWCWRTDRLRPSEVALGMRPLVVITRSGS
jgi:membrane protease YdiL (CAAX protease family)